MKLGLVDTLSALFRRNRQIAASAEELVDPRIVAVALLVHAAQVDGQAGPRERARLEALVTAELDVDPDECARLIAAAARVDADTGDVVDLARRLTLTLDAGARRDLVTLMWDLASVDGDVHEFEEAIITRVGEVFDLTPDEIAGLRLSAELERTTQG